VEPLLQAIALDPEKDHLPYLNLAECYVLQGNLDKAIQAYKDALRLRPNVVGWKEEIAKLYVQKKEYGKAIAIYQTFIDDIRQKIKKKSLKDKIAFYTGAEVTEDNERLAILYCDLADVYRQAGKREKAEEYYRRVYSLKTALSKNYSPRAMAKVAEYYRDEGKLRTAAQMLERALENMYDGDKGSREHKYLYFVYATVMYELQERKWAAKYATIYLDYIKERYGSETLYVSDLRYRPMHLFDLAIMKICSGDIDKGREYLEQIKECKLCVTCETCDCFEYYYGMGLIAKEEGRKEEAKQHFKMALAVKGDYPCAKYHLEQLQQEDLT
jgi:tetratricopeptide (TPR) repeat protein